MPTCKTNERNEGTAGADDVPDPIIPRPSMTARDVFITLRSFFLRRTSRQEWKGRGGAFHDVFRNASRSSGASNILV